MGFQPGHTMPSCKSNGRFAARSRDMVRCGLIGNVFHTLPVATLLGCLLDQAGAPQVYKTPTQLQVDLVGELLAGSARTETALLEEAADTGLIIEAGGKIKDDGLESLEAEEFLEWRGSLPHSVQAVVPQGEQLYLPQRVAQQWLVEGFIRSAEPRGSEVRLDLGVALRSLAAHRLSAD